MAAVDDNDSPSSAVAPSLTSDSVALEQALEKFRAYDRMMLNKVERMKLEDDLKLDTPALLKKLVDCIKKNAIPSISSFYVGVAGLGESGNVYFGCNMEFTGERIGATIHG